MKNYYVLIPDADEFSIVESIISDRSSNNDMLVSKNIHQINEEDLRREVSVYMIDDENTVCINFIQSGVGKVATCRTMKKLLKVFEVYGSPEHVVMAGSACGKVPGIYNIINTYQEIDLRPAGRKLGESPDLPVNYRCTGISMFRDLKRSESLTVERFCTMFPDTSEYNEHNKFVVDMEDYAFSAMLDDEEIPYSIVRGVTDEGSFDSWKDSLKSCISDIVEILFNKFGI